MEEKKVAQTETLKQGLVALKGLAALFAACFFISCQLCSAASPSLTHTTQAYGLTLSASPSGPDAAWENLLHQGLEEVFNMHYDRSKEFFEKAIAERPDRMEGHFGILIVNWEMLKDDKENKAVEKALVDKGNRLIEIGQKMEKEKKDDADSYFFLGNAQGCLALLSLWNGDWLGAFFKSSDAISRLKKALEMDPQMYDSYLGLGIYQYYIGTFSIVPRLFGSLLLINGSKEEGIKKLELAAAKGKYTRTMAKAFLSEGLGLYEKDYKGSVAILGELTKQYPDNFRYFLNEALMLSFYDRPEAIRRYEEIVRLTDGGKPTFRKEMVPFIHIMLGNLYRLEKDDPKALQEYDLCLAGRDAMPRFLTWGYLEKGRTLNLMNDDEDAQVAYKKALSLPDFNGAHQETRRAQRDGFSEEDMADKSEDTVYRLLSLPKNN